MSDFPADPTEHLKLLWKEPINAATDDAGESPVVADVDNSNVPHRVRRGTKQKPS